MRHSRMRGGRGVLLGLALAACAKHQADVEAPLPAPSYAGGPVRPAPQGDAGARPAGPKDATEPVLQETPSAGAAEIFVAWDHVDIRTTTGEVWTWHIRETKTVPHRQPFPAKVVAFDHGDGTIAVLEDGTVAELDSTILPLDARIEPRTSARLSNLSNIRAAYTRHTQTFFIRKDATVFVMAHRGYEKPVPGAPKTRPKRIIETSEVPSLTGAEEIMGGDDATCARFRDRSVRCWSSNREHNEGAKLKMLPFTFPPALAIDRELVVLADKTVRGWGRNDYAQLGDGTTEDRAAPIVLKDLTNVVQIARGSYSSCAIHDGGKLSCWGDNREYPMVPNQLVALHPKPIAITFDPSVPALAEVRIGVTTTCARVVDGRVMCWGDNWSGQVGDGSFGGERQPTFVAGFGGPGPVPMPVNAAVRVKSRAP